MRGIRVADAPQKRVACKVLSLLLDTPINGNIDYNSDCYYILNGHLSGKICANLTGVGSDFVKFSELSSLLLEAYPVKPTWTDIHIECENVEQSNLAVDFLSRMTGLPKFRKQIFSRCERYIGIFDGQVMCGVATGKAYKFSELHTLLSDIL